MKRWIVGVWLVLLMVALAACGSQAMPQARESMSVAPAQPEMPAADTSLAGEGAAPVDSGSAQAAFDERKIIYQGNLSIVVKDPAQALEQIRGIAAAADGYVSQAQLYEYGDNLLRGTVVIRVPAEKYDATVAAIKNLGSRVINASDTASDVTAEYVDLRAQLTNLEAAEKELQAMLTEVRQRPEAKPGDILEVYNALTAKRGEIEQVKGRLQYLQNQVSLSTITVDLTPDEINAPVIEEGWQPLVTIKDAFRSLVRLLQGLFDVIINLVIVVLPILLLLALPVMLVIWVLRKLARRGRRAQADRSLSELPKSDES